VEYRDGSGLAYPVFPPHTNWICHWMVCGLWRADTALPCAVDMGKTAVKDRSPANGRLCIGSLYATSVSIDRTSYLPPTYMRGADGPNRRLAHPAHPAEHRMHATLLAQPATWARFTTACVCHQPYRSRRLPAAPRNATVRPLTSIKPSTLLWFTSTLDNNVSMEYSVNGVQHLLLWRLV
jgi:hypothetical protein